MVNMVFQLGSLVYHRLYLAAEEILKELETSQATSSDTCEGNKSLPRAFVHNTLYAAAEEILREVETAITQVLCQAESNGAGKEETSLPGQEPELSTDSHKASAQLQTLQQPVSPGPLRPTEPQEGPNGTWDPEIPGPSQSNSNLDSGALTYSTTGFEIPQIKEEFEAASPLAAEIKYEIQPESPDWFPAQPEGKDGEVRRTERKRAQMKTETETVCVQSNVVRSRRRTSAADIYCVKIHLERSQSRGADSRSSNSDDDFEEEEDENVEGDGDNAGAVSPSSETRPPEMEVTFQAESSDDTSATEDSSNEADTGVIATKGPRAITDKTVQSETAGQDASSQSQSSRTFCHLCGKSFRYVGHLMKHMKTHERKVDCAICEAAFPSCKVLVGHLRRDHAESHFCDVCGKVFTSSRTLRFHKRKHKEPKQFECKECRKTFARKYHLIVHVRTHSGERPYHCDVCGKAFSQSQSLTVHKRSHSGERPYHCTVCGKLFFTNGHLKTHMRYHSGEKPYPCDICGARFAQKEKMTRHRTTHTGERPYGCHLCGMRYRFAPNLKSHMRAHARQAAQ